ncbi:hypothetical protein RMATCC62417_02098 [Rhizopus microsporus]|nr:hypothetical protein RMATCC62417_02098 [Rhizopus microsporus]
MSFEDLMKKAKEQSLAKKENSTARRPPITTNTHTTAAKVTTKSSSTVHHGPSLYHRTKKPESKNDTNNSGQSTLSVRERAKLLVSEPPKKVIGQKRDKRSIAEVQRDIRHAKGIYSDDEEDRRKNDPRLMINKNKPTQRYQSSDAAIGRKRPLSPPRPAKKLDVPRRPVMSAPIPRMPFSGRPLDRNAAKLPIARRYRNDDDDEDDDLDSFIVDDDEEEDPYYKRKNSYSDEISKIFRYDRSRYANEPVFSDDDMEANASEVLREEKRSERIARREDLIEEQKELERLKRRKKTFA